MHPYRIESIVVEHLATIGGPEVFHAAVTVTMDAKAWQAARKRGGLGQLYGVDVSNAVHRMWPRIHAYRPTVNDQARACNGVKTITLRYAISPENARFYGCWPRYSSHGPSRVTLLVTRPAPALRVVGA